MYSGFMLINSDFLNPGKANERFRNELGVDIKQLVAKDIFRKLVELAEYRNVIIHNNGICDERFVKAGIGSYHIHDIINIDITTLQEYLAALDITVKALDTEYSKTINQCMISETKLKLAISPLMALPLCLMPGQARTPEKKE